MADRLLRPTMKGAAVREHERPKSREETPKEGGGPWLSRTAHPMNAKSPTIGRMIGLNSKGGDELGGLHGGTSFQSTEPVMSFSLSSHAPKRLYP
jgi:hypothetical protein